MGELTQQKAFDIVEAVITRGDIASLTSVERAKFYVKTCESLGLNPFTKPFEFIQLNGKLTLYARKDATDQLRRLYKVSVTDLIESEHEGVLVVTAKVALPDGRTDAAKGAVAISGLKGDALANALMKAETKAKRRATLSICGLGFLDESELETIPASAKAAPPPRTMLKKDSREIYVRFQSEIAAEKSSDSLAEWREANDPKMMSLPTEWQLQLSVLFEEHMADLQRIEAGGTAPEQCAQDRWIDRQSEQWAARHTNGLINHLREAKSASDDSGIPDFLRREAEAKAAPNGVTSGFTVFVPEEGMA